MPVNIHIKDHLIIPFGCPKWDIKNVWISQVSTSGTHFQSSTKCAYIDKTSHEPLRISQFLEFMPDLASNFPTIPDKKEALLFIANYLKENCELDTKAERSFLDLYFEFILGEIAIHVDQTWMFFALMPLPQAHIYAANPLESNTSVGFNQDPMFKVDFAFWTGRQFVAVELDGGSHIGSEKHVTKDRMLARAGIHVIHILNDELDKYKRRIITHLLPPEISKPWPFDPFSLFWNEEPEPNLAPLAFNPLHDGR